MLIVARKNLFSERTRLAISVGGVALSVLLISLLLALFRGWNEKVGGYVENVDADVWIAREGTLDFFRALPVLPKDQGEELLAQHPSIKSWSSIVAVQTRATSEDDKNMDVEMVGYDTQTGIGGPLKVIEGASAPGPGEMIVDSALTKRFGVDIGEKLKAFGRDWTVVGRSTGGDFIAVRMVFVNLADAQEAIQQPGKVSYFMLQLKSPQNAKEIAGSIEFAAQDKGFPIVAITSGKLADDTRDSVLGQVVPILTVILGLAFIVGLAVAGLTIYTATVEKAREFGILKAVGFKNMYLYRVVFEQSLVTGILGFAIGVALTLLLGPFAEDFVPQFVVLIRWQDILGVLGATLVMATLAGYIPTRRLAAIDPISVFRA